MLCKKYHLKNLVNQVANERAEINNCSQRRITRIILKIVSDLLMFYQLFHSPKLKQNTLISNKLGTIYELSHELLNDLRLRILEN